MDDLISRQAAIDALFELYEYQRDIDPTEAADLVRQGIYLAEKKIEQLPSVQPDLAQLLAYECGKASAQPEIIRCKDFRHWDTTWQNDFAPNYHYCPLIDGTRRDDFYCADAERRRDK